MRSGTHGPHVPRSVGVLPGQPEVQHVALPVGGRQPAHGKVGLQEGSGVSRGSNPAWLTSRAAEKQGEGPSAHKHSCKTPACAVVTASHLGGRWDSSHFRDEETEGQ